jgi:HNH endonuclease/NUMOD4 motif
VIEEWRSIKDCPEYEVSNLGRVRSRNNKILSPWTNNQGRSLVTLFKAGSYYHKKLVHHLVLEAFVGERPEGMVGAHLNNNYSDNNMNNLIWCTQAENLATVWLSDEEIREIQSRYDVGNITQRELAWEYGISQSHISKITRRKRR